MKQSISGPQQVIPSKLPEDETSFQSPSKNSSSIVNNYFNSSPFPQRRAWQPVLIVFGPFGSLDNYKTTVNGNVYVW